VSTLRTQQLQYTHSLTSCFPHSRVNFITLSPKKWTIWNNVQSLDSRLHFIRRPKRSCTVTKEDKCTFDSITDSVTWIKRKGFVYEISHKLTSYLFRWIASNIKDKSLDTIHVCQGRRAGPNSTKHTVEIRAFRFWVRTRFQSHTFRAGSTSTTCAKPAQKQDAETTDVTKLLSGIWNKTGNVRIT
jgi:hypothetical protein